MHIRTVVLLLFSTGFLNAMELDNQQDDREQTEYTKDIQRMNSEAPMAQTTIPMYFQIPGLEGSDFHTNAIKSFGIRTSKPKKQAGKKSCKVLPKHKVTELAQLLSTKARLTDTREQ